MILLIGILFIVVGLIMYNEYVWELKIQEIDKLLIEQGKEKCSCSKEKCSCLKQKTNKKKVIKNKKRKK